MRKSLFGYNVKDVAERFKQFASVNSGLERDIDVQKNEIEKLRAHELTLSESVKKLENEQAGLLRENSELKVKLSELEEKLKEAETKSAEPSEDEKLSGICKTAYRDMESLKAMTKNELSALSVRLMNQLEMYRQKAEKFNESMIELSASSRSSFEELSNTFESCFKELDKNNAEFSKMLDEASSLKSDTSKKIGELLEERECDGDHTEERARSIPFGFTAFR